MDKKIIRNIRLEIKEDLEYLSSLKFQREIWIEGMHADLCYEWSSDVVCDYFDGLNMTVIDEPGCGLNLNVSSGVLTEKEAEILKPFNIKFAKYADNSPDYPTKEEYELMLSDPEWIKVTKMAEDVLDKIDFDKMPNDDLKDK